MVVSNIYGEVRQHEIWKCECKEGTFYLDALQGYKVVQWNYPEITPTQELLEKAKTLIKQKKNKRKNMSNTNNTEESILEYLSNHFTDEEMCEMVGEEDCSYPDNW